MTVFRAPLAAFACVLPLAACADKVEIEVAGRLFDGPNSGVVVPGATVDALDASGQSVASAVTDNQGAFAVGLPEGTTFFLLFSKTDWVTTSFTGYSGLQDLRSQDGALYIRPQAVHDDIASDFEGCVRSGGTGGSVDGVLRLNVGESYEEADNAPILTSGFAWADTADGETVVACYLPDDAGEAGTVTGESGRFALLDLAPGVAKLHLAYEEGQIADHSDEYPVYVPEGGVVPLNPAWATLP